MVRKLLKYEGIYYVRTLLLAEVCLLGMGLLVRLVQLFESDHLAYNMLMGSLVMILLLACLACGLFATAMSVVRFYKNLYSSEGYLTFTLPATVGQHLWAKLIATLLAHLSVVIAVVASLCIASAGDLLTEILKAVAYLFRGAAGLLGAHLYGYIALIFLLVAVESAGVSLLYYACLALGQLFRKNRILAAVGIFFGYWFAAQILSTVVAIVLMLLAPTWSGSLFETLFHLLESGERVFGAVYLYFGVRIVIQTVWAGLLFTLVYLITRKRLNLE